MNPTIEQAAALAWDLVKAETDPPFSSCLLDHQQKLIYHAQNVQRGGPADDAFELKVREVLADPKAAIVAIKEKLGLPAEKPADPINDPPFSTTPPEPEAASVPDTKPLAKPAKARKSNK